MFDALRRARFALPAAILGLLGACSTAPPRTAAPPEGRGFEVPASDHAPTPAASAAPAAAPIVRARSRWIPVRWNDLPGWEGDRSAELWAAFQRGCDRPQPGWARVCALAQTDAPAPMTDEATRAWLQERLLPYRVESPEGESTGLITGYFEPLVEATRLPSKGFQIPLYAPPADLQTRRPYWTRQQIDSAAAARPALKGRQLAYVSDPLDALILQIQGSGRLRITEPDGRRRLIRLAFAAHNDQPYKSVGRWLVEQGELKLEQASWPAIRSWAALHPERVKELLWSNPRFVFFREEPLPDPALGPKGAQAVPLTPGRSIAVDPQSIPYGTIAWLDTTEPLSSTPLRRAVMAQDTGSAISGAVRADYFWGWGAEAEAQAGRMKQPLRIWVLWPKATPPSP
jgi:membrane-bound lytic murein transglycosylase A